MKRLLQKLALALTAFIATIPAAFADYPMPGRQGSAPVLCTGCPGLNSQLQPNDGLKTWPYAAPLVAHAGRFLDSTETQNFQPTLRTLRAKRVRVASEQRGTAPPRLYIQLGSVLAAYSIDRFFTTALPGGLVPATRYIGKLSRGNQPVEKLVMWDAVVHPEAGGSGWKTHYADGQDRMFDFDFDDRGSVYVASGPFGWGIVKDSGQLTGQLPLTKQVLEEWDAKAIVALKVGSRYYAAVSDTSNGGRRIYDVTNPASPVVEVTKKGDQNAFISWAKDDANGRIAIVAKASKSIEIYDYDDFVAGGSPLETYSAAGGKSFKDVTVDDQGNFWTAEATRSASNSKVIKLERNGSGYLLRTFDVLGGSFSPPDGVSIAYSTVEYRDKYLTVVGLDSEGSIDLRLLRVDGGEPVRVDLNSFFKNYYWRSPLDHARPNESTISYGVFPLKWNNKVYLFQCARGLGDVFELQAGDSITVSQESGTFGTVNPYAPVSAGPFPGDILKFTATSSNPSVGYNVTWDFGNPESGADNTELTHTGDDVDHQFTGLNTTSKITQSKQVKATATVSSELTDAVSVVLKVPTARIGVKGTDVILTADGGALDVVAGDELTDSSDGTVESHYSSWTIDATTEKKKPNITMAVGAVGEHSVTLAANYGKYDDSFVSVGSPFVDAVSGVACTVRPFVASFGAHAKSSGGVTFKGVARKTSVAGVLTATSWTVEWSLQTSTSGPDVVPPTSQTVPVGTVPDFPVSVAIPSGSILKLKISVDSSGLAPEAASYASHEVTQELITPDPAIAISGCENVGDPCTLTASSGGGNPIDGWTMKWTLKRSGTKVGEFTGNPYKPTLSDDGTYTASVTASTSIFEATATTDPPFEVDPPLCSGPPPAAFGIDPNCTACKVNEDINFRPAIFNYDFQNCEEYLWDFGDGTRVTTTDYGVDHRYSTAGTKIVKLKIRKASQTSDEVSLPITVGTVITCDAPTTVTASYTGSKGCQPGVNCKTGESITFRATKNGSSLKSCDSAAWTFSDNTTSNSKSPSKTFSSPGTYTASVVVSNSNGTSSSVGVTVTVIKDTTCDAPPPARQLGIDYLGAQSGCSGANGKPCNPNESIEFTPHTFPIDAFQVCDRFEWKFEGDSTPVTSKEPTHSFPGTLASYRVTLRVHNETDTTGSTVTIDVPFPTSIKPIPDLSWTSFPTKGSKGTPVTFAVKVVQTDINATGWSWDFGDDSPDELMPGYISKTATMAHTYAAKGTFTVSVRARNAEDSSSAPTGIVVGTITVDDIPEHRYLVPVVAHADGIGSKWRTDVQVYTSDPNVSPSNPLALTASFKGQDTQLSMNKSTFIFEDFVNYLKPGASDQGAVIIAVKSQFAPQIWTRTYNQTDAGTFGQFIPAVRLDGAGQGSAVGEGMYYLAGLRSSSGYRTNVGVVNPNAQAIPVSLRIYDDHNVPFGSVITKTMQPFQLEQFPITGPDGRPFSLEVEVPEGSWLVAYASVISSAGDPAFMQAVRASELASADYRNSVIPGVGRVGDWRSDVTIFNPYNHAIVVDLDYYDQTGARAAGASAVPIGAGEFLQYDDILRQGILGNVPDSLGMLRVTVPTTVSADRFPMTFSRTYNDNGTGNTYGQGIAGFAASRANVKPGKGALIAAVRSDDKYKTNLGLTNVSGAPVIVTVKVLDPINGGEVAIYQYTLVANQSIIVPDFNLSGRTSASLRIEVTGGDAWAFVSLVSEHTRDPDYIPAMPLP